MKRRTARTATHRRCLVMRAIDAMTSRAMNRMKLRNCIGIYVVPLQIRAIKSHVSAIQILCTRALFRERPRRPARAVHPVRAATTRRHRRTRGRTWAEGRGTHCGKVFVRLSLRDCLRLRFFYPHTVWVFSPHRLGVGVAFFVFFPHRLGVGVGRSKTRALCLRKLFHFFIPCLDVALARGLSWWSPTTTTTTTTRVLYDSFTDQPSDPHIAVVKDGFAIPVFLLEFVKPK